MDYDVRVKPQSRRLTWSTSIDHRVQRWRQSPFTAVDVVMVLQRLLRYSLFDEWRFAPYVMTISIRSL